MVRETVNGGVTSNLSLIAPTSQNLNIGMQSSDTAIKDVLHTVQVLAKSKTGLQCKSRAFNVKPIWLCPDDQFDPVIWDSSGTSTIQAYDHIINEVVDFHTYEPIVHSEPTCVDKFFFIQQETSSGVFSDYLGSIIQHDSTNRRFTI